LINADAADFLFWRIGVIGVLLLNFLLKQTSFLEQHRHIVAKHHRHMIAGHGFVATVGQNVDHAINTAV